MGISKASKLKSLLRSQELSFLMEAHNGLSAKIAQEAGFHGLWGSGLALSASMDVRDNNELSWTQVLEVLEFITDATSIPLLLDGDTGYGNFNNMRRLVRKLEMREIAGVCIEDKLFPKTNSFIDGESQALADMDEFCGKIKAGKDAQEDPDFCVVARVEALIAGCGMAEALRRAEAYHAAGADAILIHSKLSKPDEVLEFKREWGNRCPVVIVPTTYYGTPTEVFRQAGFSVVIWANHLLRSCVTAMQRTAEQIIKEQSLANIEDRIAPVKEVFRLQGAAELQEAEKRYLPGGRSAPSALILAASRGSILGELTVDKPKVMIPIGGRPLLARMVDTLHAAGVRQISVVRGYRKDTVNLLGLDYIDNDLFESTKEVYSLAAGIEKAHGPLLISYGDIFCHKYILMNLLESEADFCIAVDADWLHGRNVGRYGEFVTCTHAYDKRNFTQEVYLQRAWGREWQESSATPVHGEWMGIMKTSPAGLNDLKKFLKVLSADELKKMRMAELLNRLVDSGRSVSVIYTRGHWLDIDELKDVMAAANFGNVAR